MKENKISLGEMLVLLAGMGMIAACVHYIMIEDGLVMGSISGLVIVIMKVIPMSASTLTFILNIGLFIIGYIFIGKEFGLKTMLASVLLPLYMRLFEAISPNPESLSGNLVIDIVVLMVVLSFGQALLFHINASSGGLDIVVKLMNKYLHMKIGTALQISGLVICALSFFTYGRETMVIGMVVTYVNGIVIDHFSDGFLIKKKVCVISDKYEEIQKFIIHDLRRGATLYEVYGGATGKKRVELQTILEKSEYARLLAFIAEKDPCAFMATGNVAEVIGEWNKQKRRF